MSLAHTTACRIHLDGTLYSFRRWASVPRVGDEIAFGDKADTKIFRVTRVVWGLESEDDYARNLQTVHMEIAPL